MNHRFGTLLVDDAFDSRADEFQLAVYRQHDVALDAFKRMSQSMMSERFKSWLVPRCRSERRSFPVFQAFYPRCRKNQNCRSALKRSMDQFVRLVIDPLGESTDVDE